MARQLGVPTATLRSWSQRYGIGPARHVPGQHRLYSDADLTVVHRMHALILDGASPASAAISARGEAPANPDGAAALLAAAAALDSAGMASVLDTHIAHHGVLDAWEHLIRPAFTALDARQRRGEDCIDVEHALSWTVVTCLQRIPTPALPASITLCCTEFETHTLAVEALRAALAERRRATVMLGATTPPQAVLDALGRSPATAVVLYARTARTADEGVAAAAASVDGIRVLLAGDGWAQVTPPVGAVWVNSLDEALRHLAG